MGKPDAKTNTPSPEWAKHQRPYGKRTFWKKIRKAAKKKIAKEKP